MRVLFLAENYLACYSAALRDDPGLMEMTYQQVCEELFGRHFYHGDSHARELRARGHQAWTLVPDCSELQELWARERRMWLWPEKPPCRKLWRALANRAGHSSLAKARASRILLAQVRRLQPDVIQVFSGVDVTRGLLEQLRSHCRLLVGQWSCALLEGYPYDAYDLMLTTVPELRKAYLAMGVASDLVDHSINPSCLPPATPARDLDVVFIGSLTPDHAHRTMVLERIAGQLPMVWYGRGLELLASDSPLRAAWRGGPLMGEAMFGVLQRARIALHVPIDVGRSHFGAKRPYEVTACGALLMTEDQPGIRERFVMNEEVVVFADAEQAVARIRELLADPQRLAAIAQAGTRRTLADHVDARRMEDWESLVMARLSALPPRASNR